MFEAAEKKDAAQTDHDRRHPRRPAHAHDPRRTGRTPSSRWPRQPRRAGYAYIAITDHSKSQAIANGLTVERLLKHVQAIRKADAKMKGIRILAGLRGRHPRRWRDGLRG